MANEAETLQLNDEHFWCCCDSMLSSTSSIGFARVAADCETLLEMICFKTSRESGGSVSRTTYRQLKTVARWIGIFVNLFAFLTLPARLVADLEELPKLLMLSAFLLCVLDGTHEVLEELMAVFLTRGTPGPFWITRLGSSSDGIVHIAHAFAEAFAISLVALYRMIQATRRASV